MKVEILIPEMPPIKIMETIDPNNKANFFEENQIEASFEHVTIEKDAPKPIKALPANNPAVSVAVENNKHPNPHVNAANVIVLRGPQ